VEERVAIEGGWQRRAWIVDDEPAAATLAADLCAARGAAASVYRLPLPFLTDLRSGPSPDVIVLDWRLENELSAALFMAVRHRYPRMPIIFWTGSRADALPDMVQADRYAVVVDKASGSAPFEDALSWALDDEQGPPPAV
jgi:FixJ family two-component response regulator